MKNNWRHAAASVLGAVAVGVMLKAALLFMRAVPFNSDEAVVALMARHIGQGARPTFFYGQAYMGSLDAWLVAGAFRLFGESVMAVRAVQMALYALYLLAVWQLARRWFLDPRVAHIAVWLSAVPPVMVMTYTTATLGGYNESILLGALILWLGWEVTSGGHSTDWRYWLGLGLIGGVAFWVLGLAGVYLLPVGVWGLRHFRRALWPRYALAALLFALGSSPWWLYNFTHGNAALNMLLGRADPATGIGAPVLDLSARAVGFALLGLPAALGLRPPWSAEFLPAPLLFVALLIYGLIAAYHLWGARRGQPPMAPGARALLWLFGLGFAIVFIGTHFGTDATGRYFLPLVLALTLGAASALARLWQWRATLGGLGVALVLGLNGYGLAHAALSADKFTTQFDPITRFDNQHDAELIQFLDAHQLTRGYSNYWVTFRLAFLSSERLIYSAELPYKANLTYNRADNRYPPYKQLAAESSTAAYITTRHPVLDERIRIGLAELGVTFAETQIGDYHIFYALSRKVTPEALGLGGAP